MAGFLGHLWASLLLFIFVFLSTLTANVDVKLSVGAILDYTSLAGKEEKVAMEMAVVDSCAASHHHGVTLHIMDSCGDPVRAAASAKELISKQQVRVILGLNRREETLFAAEVANKSQVPLLSLANDVPPWATQQWPFLVSVARSQHTQMKAVAAIVQSWKWRKVTLVYEETFTINPHLITSLHEANSVIDNFVPLPPFPPYSLSEKLLDLKKKQGRVFIVHASIELAANLFMEAKEMGMMEEEYVWITTDAITSRVDSLNTSVISAMQGVIGVKSYFPHTHPEYKEFSSRFKAMFRLQYPNDPYIDPGTNVLQAYDAVWAVALALAARSHTRNWTNHNFGWNVLDNIYQISFKGLADEFSLRSGKLEPADIFRIINIVGKSYREIGYWSDGSGFSSSIGQGSNYSHLMKILGQVYWPGGPWSVPKGWDVPTIVNKLKIGVPATTTFGDFVRWRYNRSGGDPIAEGFSIDVFKAVVDLQKYKLSYSLIPYNGTYNELVQQIPLKVFDGAIGDIAILANRCDYGEFSQPYSESGIQMVVYAPPRKAKRQWLFKKPFTMGMWVTTFVINVYNGFVVWFIERNNNQDFESNNKFGTTLWLAFTTLFTALQGDKVHTNVARMVVVVWLFVALVITSSFTASLTSFLTLQNVNPKVVDVETLIKSGAKVGCDRKSFVPKYLENVLLFHPDNIKKYDSGDEYPPALKNGEIDAAFLEVPYVKVLLAKYCSNFTTGATYKVGGFGFVFARGAPYLPDISAAILNVSETGQLLHLENKMLSSYNCSTTDQTEFVHDSVGLDSFSVLFAITALTSTFALLITKFCETKHERALQKEPQQQAGHQDHELHSYE